MLVARVRAGLVVTMVLVIALYTGDSSAFFRHLCHGEVGVGRIDPIVTPGKASAHCHGIHGAQSKFRPPVCDRIC
jgi:hypothetical protein